jgi:hypothetical protein
MQEKRERCKKKKKVKALSPLSLSLSDDFPRHTGVPQS